MPDRPSVLLVVADGLRPDVIDPAVMPYLAAVRDEGCQYMTAVAAFPAVTRANAASLVTGCLPARHGVFGNRVWHAATGVIDTGNANHVRRLRAAGAMPQPSLGELVNRAGSTSVVIGNGSAGCTYLLNPGSDTGRGAAVASVGSAGSPTSGLPPAAGRALTRLGLPPASADDSLDWAGNAAVECLDALAPDLLVFWSGQPDTVHHHTGPWSANSRETLRHVDEVIRKLHHAALSNGRPCNLIVTADHGFCESSESLELDDDLDAAADAAGISRDDVIATFNGGVVLVYLRDHVPLPDRARLAEHLTKQEWAGPVLCDDRYCPDTAFPASTATGGQSSFAPDLFVTMRTSATEPFDDGAPPRAVHARSNGAAPYAGVHGSLHPTDLRIPLILHGPAFKARALESSPAGIIDIAPTVHQLLVDEPLPGADGRVLTEALRGSITDPHPSTEFIRERGGHRLAFRHAGHHRYLVGGVTAGAQQP